MKYRVESGIVVMLPLSYGSIQNFVSNEICEYISVPHIAILKVISAGIPWAVFPLNVIYFEKVTSVLIIKVVVRYVVGLLNVIYG